MGAMCFQNIEVTYVRRPLIVREIICKRQTIWFFRLTHGKCQSALLHCIMTHIWLA